MIDVTISLKDEQIQSLVGFLRSIGRTDVREMIERGAECDLQPTMEAIVEVCTALREAEARLSPAA